MIMRIYRCTVFPGKEAEHREYAFKSRHPALSRENGLIAFYAGRPLPGDDDRSRCLVQIWETLAAIKKARGEFWDKPMKSMPEEIRSIYETATVEHFELADEYQAGGR